MNRGLAASLLLAACSGDRLLGDDVPEATTSAVASSETTTSGGEASTSTTSSDDALAETTSSSTSGAGSISDDGCGFLCNPDGGSTNIECDVWAQDCPPGQKCMPWANDGGSSWNALRCSPIADDPAQPGEPCTVEGSGVSGIDDCDLASMCWNVDPETNTGVCYDFCRGSEASPLCLDSVSYCTVANEGVLILCRPLCSPLAQDCREGEACYAVEDAFACAPAGQTHLFGEYCEFLNGCDPGLFCADPADVPDCMGTIGCCSSFCDLQAADPDATCHAYDPQLICVPWYAPGQSPPGFEFVGGCRLPP